MIRERGSIGVDIEGIQSADDGGKFCLEENLRSRKRRRVVSSSDAGGSVFFTKDFEVRS